MCIIKNFKDIKTPIELLDFMSNINYGFMTNDGIKYTDYNNPEWSKVWASSCIVQDGNGVLESMIGTCFDQVELERKWFSENNYKFKTIFLIFEVDKENDYPTHTFLMYEENNKFYWFENSFDTLRGIHEYSTYDELIKCVKDEHFKYASDNSSLKDEDYKLLKCYEYGKPVKDIYVLDFIDRIVGGDK